MELDYFSILDMAYLSQQWQEIQILSLKKWRHSGSRLFCLQLFLSMCWKIFSMRTSLAYFINNYPVKPCILKAKKVLVENAADFCHWKVAKAADFCHRKVAKTKVLKLVNHLPCRCWFVVKSCVSSGLFEEWVCKLDRNLLSDEGKSY